MREGTRTQLSFRRLQYGFNATIAVPYTRTANETALSRCNRVASTVKQAVRVVRSGDNSLLASSVRMQGV